MVFLCQNRIQPPPVCGVHNAVLVEKQVSIDQNQPSLGLVTCLICPVSKAVVLEQ
jgi:hypothetical protein